MLTVKNNECLNARKTRSIVRTKAETNLQHDHRETTRLRHVLTLLLAHPFHIHITTYEYHTYDRMALIRSRSLREIIKIFITAFHKLDYIAELMRFRIVSFLNYRRLLKYLYAIANRFPGLLNDLYNILNRMSNFSIEYYILFQL